MRKQLGMSLGGLILLLILVVFFAYAGARVVPAYMDYWTLEHVMDNALDPLSGEPLTPHTIRKRFEKELSLNNLKTVAVSDLDIQPMENGYRLTVEYTVKEPFWREIHLCMDFVAEREAHK